MSISYAITDEQEEHALRIAKIHHRASLIYKEMTGGVYAVDTGKDSEVVTAIANAFASYTTPDLRVMAHNNPADLVFRILAAGMTLQQMLDNKDSRIKSLRRELHTLPQGLSKLLEAINEMVEANGLEIIATLNETPEVKKEYEQLEKDFGS